MYKRIFKTYHNKKHNTQPAQMHSMNAFNVNDVCCFMLVGYHIFAMQSLKTRLYID
jgi:hypothetical protein